MRIDPQWLQTFTELMRGLKLLTLTGAMLGMIVMTGCSSTKHERAYEEVPGDNAAQTSTPTASADDEQPELIVTPDLTLIGSIVSVNPVGRFVVLSFPLGRMPAIDSTLFVYRQGLKVGELKVTGPQQDDHIVADITDGECHVQDEVRDR